MRPMKRHKIETGLVRKGFKTGESHHRLLILHVGGHKTGIRTKLSHGITEYGRELLAQMAKSLHLTNQELQDLVDCPLSEEDYVRLLAEKGYRL